MLMIPQIGQIGVKFSGMLRHLQSTGIHRHITHRISTTTMGSRLKSYSTKVQRGALVEEYIDERSQVN